MTEKSPGIAYLAMLDEDLRLSPVPSSEGQYFFRQLVELRDAGILTDAEFTAAKARLGSEI